MVPDASPSTFGELRSPKVLPPLQTSFTEPSPSSGARPSSRWRRTRPPPPSTLSNAQPLAPPTAHPARTLEHRPSKMSLFSLFGRSKVEQAKGIPNATPAVDPDEPATPETPVVVQRTVTLRSDTSNERLQPSRAKSMPVARTRSQKGAITKRSRQPAHWVPPPLFQAYPQAIKHATLWAAADTTEAILKKEQHKIEDSMLEAKIDGVLGITAPPPREKRDKASNRQEKGRPGTSSRLSAATVPMFYTPELTKKVYVLATVGYILQYAGDGPSDRVPEKTLQLGKESAAFASDLIPGKHWVLQIFKAANEDGSAAIQSKSFLSRLRNTTTKRSATDFLLVFESAEEMNSWMSAVRRVIEGLGGTKYHPDTVESSCTAASESKPVSDKPSHRYNVQRDPNRFSVYSQLSSPVGSHVGVPPDWERSTNRAASDSASIVSSPYNSVRQSAEISSLATTAASNDQVQLSQLREESRLSVMSSTTSGTGSLTMATSRGSTPAPPSPSLEPAMKPELDSSRKPAALRSFQLNPNSVSNNRRRSIQTLPTTDEHLSLDTRPSRAHRHSTYGPSIRDQSESSGPMPLLDRFPVRTGHKPPPIKLPLAARSSSAPAPRVPLPPPPPTDSRSTRPHPILDNLSAASMPSSNSANRRTLSPASPTSSFRPIPIRIPELTDFPSPPSDSNITPRRDSSLSPLPLPINTSYYPSSPRSMPPLSPQQEAPPTQQPKTLRRPTSMQIRADPAPFLSSARPLTSYNQRVSSTVSGTTSESNRPSTAASPRHRVQNRKSMPIISLPPPAPPPTMPLPPPPPAQSTVPGLAM